MKIIKVFDEIFYLMLVTKNCLLVTFYVKSYLGTVGKSGRSNLESVTDGKLLVGSSFETVLASSELLFVFGGGAEAFGFTLPKLFRNMLENFVQQMFFDVIFK